MATLTSWAKPPRARRESNANLEILKSPIFVVNEEREEYLVSPRVRGLFLLKGSGEGYN